MRSRFYTPLVRVLEYVLEYSYTVHVYSSTVLEYTCTVLEYSSTVHVYVLEYVLVPWYSSTIAIIKGERTRVEKQMLGGGLRALYR